MRRQFLKTIAAVPVLVAARPFLAPFSLHAQEKVQRLGGPKLKTSLNAYSFNEPLRSGEMTLEDLLDFCAEVGFDGVDLTGYYFPGYPEVPEDEDIYRIKRKAFLLGLDVSGTGVRNDFTYPDPEKRRADVTLATKWIEVAAKLGAPVIRIFAGKQDTAGYAWEQVADWMVKDIKECVACGQEHGVIVAIQNHNDFIKTAEEALTILRMVDSRWFGLILDTGSFRTGDPYAQIAATAPHAVNWQVKELMTVSGREEATDLRRIVAILRGAGYRGYVPIETLGQGDPRVKVRRMFQALQQALSQ
jgi:sugar phosphate isomerase/epimerase